MQNQHGKSSSDEDRFFVGQPGGFDTPLGPEPECFSARRIVTMVDQGVQLQDREHMRDCYECMQALVRYLQAERKFAVYLPEPTCTAKPMSVPVEMFGAPELIVLLDEATLRLEGGLLGFKPHVRTCESTLLALTFEQAQVPEQIQRELAVYLELVKPVTITGMLRGGGAFTGKGEIILRNQGAKAG
jgi:hypothetical protein